MEKSIVNRSNNKNFGKRHKFAGGLTAKLEKKNIESFRGQENAIKEETASMNFSDDDQDLVATPHDGKDRSLGLAANRNPTYARITHASKQMEFLGPLKDKTVSIFRN